MKVWHTIVQYDGEIEVTTHLTVGGALLAALAEIIHDFFDINSEEAFLHWKSDHLRGENCEELVGCEWNVALMRDYDPKELWKIYDFWSEWTWDTPSMDISISASTVQP